MPLKQNARGLWVARWYTTGKKTLADGSPAPREQLTFPKGTTYAKALTEYRKQLSLAGLRAGKTLINPTFAALAAAWRNDHLPTLKDKQNAETRLDVFEKRFGNRRADTIGPRDVLSYHRERLADGANPATINRELVVLRGVFGRALAWGMIEKYPFPRGSAPDLKENKGKDVWLTREEWEKFIAAFDDGDAWGAHIEKVRRLGPVTIGDGSPEPRRYGGGRAPDSKASREYLARVRAAVPVFKMLLACAARLSEVTNLRWRDVDLDAGIIRIHQGKTSKDKVLELSGPIREVLDGRHRGTPDALVFTRPDGKPWDKVTISRICGLAVKLSGVRPDFTPHAIRHTAATWASAAGVPLVAVARLLGDSTAAVAARYAHHQPSDLRAALEGLGSATKRTQKRFGRHLGATSNRLPRGHVPS